MEFLLRDDAPFTREQWEKIDSTLINSARQVLVGRRFIKIYGPLGAGVQSINIDDFGTVEPGNADFLGDVDDRPVKTVGRRFVEIPMVYKDLQLSWRDLEKSRQLGLPLELSPVAGATAICAEKEDKLIFLGDTSQGYEGLLTATGVQTIARSDWREGENAFQDIAKGIESLIAKGYLGKFVLTVSPNLYMQLQRIQPGTGLLELDRVRSLVNGNLYQSAVLGSDKAVLVCAEPQNIDLVIGQDMVAAYLGSEKLNHSLRILETILLRIKRKEAIVVFQ